VENARPTQGRPTLNVTVPSRASRCRIPEFTHLIESTNTKICLVTRVASGFRSSDILIPMFARRNWRVTGLPQVENAEYAVRDMTPNPLPKSGSAGQLVGTVRCPGGRSELPPCVPSLEAEAAPRVSLR
jgi:hypothetical protein